VIFSLLSGILTKDVIPGSIVLATGLLCAYYASEGKKITYIFGLMNYILIGYISLKNNLYGIFACYILLFAPLQIQGFLTWNKNSDKEKTVQVRSFTLRNSIMIISSCIIGSLLFAYLLIKIPGQQLAFLDAASNCINLCGVILMILRFKESWWLWLINNVIDLIIWTIMTIQNSTWMMLLTSLGYLLINIYGIIKWSHSAKKEKNMKIVLNHKCNLTKNEFLIYQEEMAHIKTTHDLIMCPSNLYLSLTTLDNISLGAQNVSKTTMGAHTGEVAASQLKAMNVEYALVGHSERRRDYNEKEEEIQEKIERLLEQGITPILCVGETLEERDRKETIASIERQLSILKNKEEENIIVAYEPTWAIGTGLVPTVEEIDEVLEKIHISFPQYILLYGGSATDKNIEYLKTSKYIDGYLLGGLSLKPKSLQNFLNLC